MCLRAVAVCAIAFTSFGCSGQNLEGSWLGPLPYEDTKACRIKIYSDERFDVACGKMAWAGAGHYRRNGDRLDLKFEALAINGAAQKVKPDLRLTFVGEGNRLRLKAVSVGDAPLVWDRAKV